MASYLPSIFQASSMPKRLLQYALSRLDILDTDALDLENLDIAFGKNSVFEFRDVGLRLKKLETLLQLPPSFKLLKSRVLILRLTIPVDIYSRPIQVEVNGVECQLCVRSVEDKGTKSRTDHERIRKRTRSKSHGDIGSKDLDEEHIDTILPSAADLAQSFLQTQPRPEETAELEAALQSEIHEYGTDSVISEDGDYPLGTGTPLSLPAFMTGFLQGIVDRLEVRISNVVLNLDVDVSNDLAKSPTANGLEPVTVQLRVEKIDIEGVTHGVGEREVQDGEPSQLREGKRLISLSQIYGTLVTEASFFSSLARSTAPSSPSAPHSEVFSDRRALSKASSVHGAGSRVFDGQYSDRGSLSTSKLSDRPASSSSSESEPIKQSLVVSSHGRFDDASEDEMQSNMSQSLRVDSELGNSSVFHNSAYLDQISESRYLDHEEDEEENDPPPGLYTQVPLRQSLDSYQSSPRASLRSPTILAKEDKHPPSVFPKREPSSMLQSSFLPGRKRFSEARLSQSQISLHSATRSIAPEPAPPKTIHGAVSQPDSNISDEDDTITPVGEEALAHSQYFSHDDAESMYLSAVSHKSASGLPGAWGSNDGSDPPSAPGSPDPSRSDGPKRDNLEHALRAVPVESIPEPQLSASSSPVESVRASQRLSFSSSPTNEVPPVESHAPSNVSERSHASSDEYSKLSKHIFFLDIVDIYISSPNSTQPNDASNTHLSNDMAESMYGGQSVTSKSLSVDVPGAFSTHIHPPNRSSRTRPASSQEQVKPKIEGATSQTDPIEMILGHLQTHFDISVGRLIYKLIQRLSEAFKEKLQEPKPHSKAPRKQETTAQHLDFTLHAKEISLKFLERLDGRLISARVLKDTGPWSGTPDSDILLRTILRGLNIKTKISESVSKTNVTLKNFLFGYAHDNILSFDAALQMRSSTRDLHAEGVDVSAEITSSGTSTRFEVNTLPVHFSVDLQKLDETFSWFGGLSSVLNMGSSIASNATITATSPVKSKPRGVRFDTPIQPDDKSMASQNKADIRIGGFVLDLIGSECSIGLETSALKLVHRDTGIGASISKIKLSGPHLRRSNDEPAINVEVTGTRLEYLPAPRDSDLERLLNIITPSKTKYDQADDILLDTLVRQRKQGPVLNINVENVQARVDKIEELSYFPELGEEVAKLATVAKYLPEADRPGMLALLKVSKFDGHVDVNDTLGSLQISAADVDVAQITLPILVAIGVGQITARRNGNEELIGPASDAALRDPQARAPALMARMIGDELEPTIKVKLWNLKLEYRVPTLMVLLGLADTASPQDLSASIAASVATLTGIGEAKTRKLLSPKHLDEEPSDSNSKPLNVDVTIKDCVLGLNPLELPSKLLVVLTVAHVNATLPKDQNVSASVEINKASLLIIDNVAHILPADAVQRTRRTSFDGSSQVADLCATGYVSVSYISSAKVNLQVTGSQDAGHCLDVEVRDDLFVLESCADSTQTLISIMNGLAPPSKPTKVTKYRTKVIPVHDLLASLSGDAFGTAEGQYNFDDDFGLGQGSDIGDLAGEGALDDLEFDSQYYQADISDDAYDEAVSEDLSASLHSARLTSTDTQDGVLLESVLQSDDDPEENEPLEFHDDHFATGSMIEGTAHKWNSAKNTYDTSNSKKVRQSPLKVCVRDVHIIWNLFDGYDWQHTRDVITKAVQDVESKAIEKRARNERRTTFDIDIDDDETVIGDFLFNSIYIGIPANRDPRELSAAINQELNDAATETESIAATTVSASPSRQGGSYRPKSKRLRLNRSKHHKITFELRGVSVDLVTFPPGSGETQSSIDVRVHDLEVYDHIPTSTWKLFATYMQEAGERETGSSMVHIELLNVRPIPELAASEIVLKATVLPLRLHVDQDALDFITRFFEFKDDSAPSSNSPPGELPFLQRAEVNSVQVKLDFKPKRVDYAGLRSGHTTEFMNFLILEEADMVLRHTIIYGVSGFEKLGKCLNDIWMPDIKRNQLPGILAGLAPVRQLVNVGGGLQKLVVVPMREYQKDGRIVRSISKGAAAFAKTTGTELVKLGAKVAIGVQTVLQGAEGFLGPTVDTSDQYGDDEDEGERKKISLYANQPVGVMQGLKGGYAGLQRDLVIARDAIIAVPGEVMEDGSAAGVLRAVRKHAPTVILRPAIGVAKAGGQILMGATNSLDPSNLQRADAKYKKH